MLLEMTRIITTTSTHYWYNTFQLLFHNTYVHINRILIITYFLRTKTLYEWTPAPTPKISSATNETNRQKLVNRPKHNMFNRQVHQSWRQTRTCNSKTTSVRYFVWRNFFSFQNKTLCETQPLSCLFNFILLTYSGDPVVDPCVHLLLPLGPEPNILKIKTYSGGRSSWKIFSHSLKNFLLNIYSFCLISRVNDKIVVVSELIFTECNASHLSFSFS